MATTSAGSKPSEIYWTMEMLVCLGKMPDRDIASRFGITCYAVSQKRLELGIPGVPGPKRKVKWTPKMLKDLRTMSGRAFERRYRAGKLAARLKRKELGLPAPSERNRPRFTPAMIALLGRRPDQRLARGFHMSLKQVRKMRLKLGIRTYKETFLDNAKWPREALALLGTMSDEQVAKRLGTHRGCVSVKRYALGIPRFNPPYQWTRKTLALLGRKPDGELARELGVTTRIVEKKRYKLGIPSHRSRLRARAAALLKQPPAGQGTPGESGAVPACQAEKAGSE
jgi:hypothetical protein